MWPPKRAFTSVRANTLLTDTGLLCKRTQRGRGTDKKRKAAISDFHSTSLLTAGSQSIRTSQILLGKAVSYDFAISTVP